MKRNIQRYKMESMTIFLMGVSVTINVICLYLLKIIYDKLAEFKVPETKINTNTAEQKQCSFGNVGTTKIIKNDNKETTIKMLPENNEDIANLIGKPSKSIVQFGQES